MPLKVIFLNMQGLGVGEWRHWTPARAMERAGHKVTYFPAINNETAFTTLSRKVTPQKLEATLLEAAKQHDIIHCGYSTIIEHLEALAAMRNYGNTPLLTDIDDDILNVPPYNASFKAYHGGSMERRIARMHLRISDAVSVSTPELSNILANDSRHTNLLPNLPDAALWTNLPRDPARADDKAIRVLFPGGQGRYGDLIDVGDGLTQAMDYFDGRVSSDGLQRQRMHLFFLGCVPDWAAKWLSDNQNPTANRVFVLRGGPYPTYRALLTYLQPDIIFSPVVHNQFNRSKSCIKAYESAFAGSAFLCSNYPTYADVPDDGCVKVHDNSPNAWFEALSMLVHDRERRLRTLRVLKDWTASQQIDNHIQKWVHSYEDVLSKPLVCSLDDIVRPQELNNANSSQRMVNRPT